MWRPGIVMRPLDLTLGGRDRVKRKGRSTCASLEKEKEKQARKEFTHTETSRPGYAVKAPRPAALLAAASAIRTSAAELSVRYEEPARRNPGCCHRFSRNRAVERQRRLLPESRGHCLAQVLSGEAG